MTKVDLYSNAICSDCAMAKKLLESNGATVNEWKVDEDEMLYIEMIGRSDRLSAPQIFINDQHIGDYNDLLKLHQKGALETLLNNKE